uniref:Protein phosphatase 1 regulatory subunit 26 n=1 Tax=Pelusios castaneus TaxID=367368 RepID=A0A8C8R7H7_9SAUR
MFLMNVSPLIALQTKWESFGQSRSCSYPVCFSESEEDVTRSSVSTKVQMIINNLQSQESPLGMNNEYDGITRRKRKGEKRGNRLTPSTVVLQQHAEYAKFGCPADSDGAEVEESSEFGTLLLDSDSDDSVDRDIEEAIQEYLKKKNKSIQPLPRSAECSDRTDGDKKVKKEPLQNKVTSSLLPMTFKAKMVTDGFISDHVGICGKLRSASPLSISSDDSFEQSIHAEIVQFLNEKKQHETNKCVIVQDEKLEERETQEKSVFKCNKESVNKANRSTLKQGCKGLLLRHQPKQRKTNVQSKCLKSKINEDPSDFSKANQAHFKMTAASQPWVVEQNEGESKRNFCEARGERIMESTLLSDSSSDDGIEEAIQLYQLEKIRKEANPTTDLQKGVADISTSLTINATKSAPAEVHKKTLSNRRREINTKSTQLKSTGDEFNKLFKPLKKARSCTSPVNKIAKCELTLQASCRADTSAELMCAEAILDISKTILPPPVGNEDKPLAANPFFYPHSTPSSCCERDNSPVDSDDSIEQEIRAFLALKAQSESLGTKPDPLSLSVQRPLSSEPNNIIGGLEPSLPKTLNLSLSRKRRLKGENKVAKQSTDQKPEELEMGSIQAGYGDSPKIPVLQDGSGLNSPRKACDAGRYSNKETSQQMMSTELAGFVDKPVALDFTNRLMEVHCNTKELIKNTVQAQERDGTDDKSSSLDSDEDLDSAIKDLLRSKRKLKKKSKDQKMQCKKRVRFGDTETQLLDELSSLPQKDWKCKSPILLKSCLSKSCKDTKENALRTPQNIVNGTPTEGRPESVKDIQVALQLNKECKPKPVSSQNNREAAKNKKCSLTATSATDDSSVDSDDSIEQEIRKFLAEKAKDSANNMEIQRDNLTARSLRGTQARAMKGKPMHQLIENETGVLSSKSKKIKKVSQQTDELKSSRRTVKESAGVHDYGKSASFAENVYLHTTVELQADQGTLWTKDVAGGGLSVKGNAVGKKGNIEPTQKTLSSMHSKGDGCKLQNYFNAKSNSKRNSTFQLKISSKFIAGLKYARDRKRSVLLNKRQNAELSLPHSSTLKTEVAPQEVCALEQKSEALVQNGTLGGEGKAGIKEANSTQNLIVEETGLHVAETCEKLEAAPSHVKTEANEDRKDTTLGDEQTYGISDSNPNPPLQEPIMAAVTGGKVSMGTFIFESQNTYAKEEEGDRQQDSSRQEEINVPNSSLDGKMLVQQSREAECKEDKTQEALDRNSGEFSDIAVEECTSLLVKSKVSDL